MKSLKTLLALLLALAFVAAACGGDDDDLPDEPAQEAPAEADEAVTVDERVEGFPVTIAAGNGDVTLEDQPSRIVSISTVATETLFAIGAGDLVVAVDDQSNHPPEAPVTDLSGFAPSVEAIAEFEPDLVILSFDPGDIIAGLDALGIPTILHGTAFSLDDAYTQIEQIGAVTGHLAEAAALVAEMQTRIDTAVASVEPFDTPPSIFHEVSFDLFSSTSTTFIGQLYALFGVENIADPADEEGFGFPQLSAEYILEADPRHHLPRRRPLRRERRHGGSPPGVGRPQRRGHRADRRAGHRHRQPLGTPDPRPGRSDGRSPQHLRRRRGLIAP